MQSYELELVVLWYVTIIRQREHPVAVIASRQPRPELMDLFQHYSDAQFLQWL